MYMYVGSKSIINQVTPPQGHKVRVGRSLNKRLAPKSSPVISFPYKSIKYDTNDDRKRKRDHRQMFLYQVRLRWKVNKQKGSLFNFLHLVNIHTSP